MTDAFGSSERHCKYSANTGGIQMKIGEEIKADSRVGGVGRCAGSAASLVVAALVRKIPRVGGLFS
jgi:hypothetical protein